MVRHLVFLSLLLSGVSLFASTLSVGSYQIVCQAPQNTKDPEQSLLHRVSATLQIYQTQKGLAAKLSNSLFFLESLELRGFGHLFSAEFPPAYMSSSDSVNFYSVKNSFVHFDHEKFLDEGIFDLVTLQDNEFLRPNGSPDGFSNSISFSLKLSKNSRSTVQSPHPSIENPSFLICEFLDL